MEQIVRTARLLREQHQFRGYIHLKTIPDADSRLIEEAGRLADRLSINIELPREASFGKLAPQKDVGSIRKAMGGLRNKLEEHKSNGKSRARAPTFAPAGQSTQMIVGADGERDEDILRTSSSLYGSYALKRVYYSAFSPFPGASSRLPPRKPPLMREHRLYQADWLYRFYGFNLDEILAATDDGMLDLSIDPKTAWALKNRGRFPIDINRADREWLLRIPGLGVKSVDKILSSRRHGTLRLGDLQRLSGNRKSILSFVTTPDWRPRQIDSSGLPERIRPPQQLSLF
jgi:putative DNA modification/repair radical SAM protein